LLDNSRFTLAAINGIFAAGDSIGKITSDVVNDAKEQDDSVNVNDFMAIMDEYLDKIVVHPEITAILKKACSTTDIAGYNYMTARYAIDAEEEPNRIMVGSETYPPEIATNWNIITKYPQLIGDFTWTGWDYLGEAGVGIPAYSFGEGGFGAKYPAKLAYTGDIDITGFRRPLSYYRQIVFGLRKNPYIAVQNPYHYGEKLIKTPWVMSDTISSWSFKNCHKKPVIIEVYSAGDEVELFLNDRSLGREVVKSEDKCRILFETEYEEGILKVVAYKDGVIQGEYVLETVNSRNLSLSIDSDMPEMADMVFINISVGENKEAVNTGIDCELTIELEGDGELMGFGSGNPKAEESYLGNITKTWNGRALAIVKKGKNKTKVKISADNGSVSEIFV